ATRRRRAARRARRGSRAVASSPRPPASRGGAGCRRAAPPPARGCATAPRGRRSPSRSPATRRVPRPAPRAARRAPRASARPRGGGEQLAVISDGGVPVAERLRLAVLRSQAVPQARLEPALGLLQLRLVGTARGQLVDLLVDHPLRVRRAPPALQRHPQLDQA